MIRRRLRLLPLLILTVVWTALWGRLVWWFVVSGLVVAALVLVVFPLPPIASGIKPHPLRLAVLIGRFAFDLVVASVEVAWKAVRPGGVEQGAVLTVHLDETDDLRRTLIAELTSLVPGTIVIDLDPGSGDMILHVLDTCDPERLRREEEKVLATQRRVAWALGDDLPGWRAAR